MAYFDNPANTLVHSHSQLVVTILDIFCSLKITMYILLWTIYTDHWRHSTMWWFSAELFIVSDCKKIYISMERNRTFFTWHHQPVNCPTSISFAHKHTSFHFCSSTHIIPHKHQHYFKLLQLTNHKHYFKLLQLTNHKHYFKLLQLTNTSTILNYYN